MPADQVWTLDHGGRRHRVEASGSTAHRVRWYVDGEPVGEARSWDDTVVVEPGGATTGRLVVRFSALGRPRRATLYAADEDARALTGLGGTDLVPAEGSPAATYEARVREHPTRHAAIAIAGGVAKVVVPLLLGLVAVRFAVAIPWPGVPLPDLPDLPRIPWPDLPSIPWPDPPAVGLPGWLRWVLDKAKYVWPVVLAYVLARAEVNRRREQDRRRAEAADAELPRGGSGDAGEDGPTG